MSRASAKEWRKDEGCSSFRIMLFHRERFSGIMQERINASSWSIGLILPSGSLLGGALVDYIEGLIRSRMVFGSLI
jgi:hypothetical protein